MLLTEMEDRQKMTDTKKLMLVGGFLACTVSLGGFFLSPAAKADTWNKKTIVTLGEPIIAGNVVLEPGTYVWKLMDSQSDRHIVQISNERENHIYTTILAIPNYRLRPTDHTRFAFWETPEGVPKAVRAWFYPGDNFGQEFAYPKKLVAQLAAARPVHLPEELQPVPPEPAPAAEPEPAPAPQPEPEVTPAPEPEPAPAPPQATPAPAPAPVPQTSDLPKTASVFPMIGLLGLASLSISGLMSLAGKRS
jgi:hypothetical protein